VTGGWRKGQKEGDLDFYSLLNVVQRGTRWVENVANMGEKGNYKGKYQTESSY
jgi:hypothetical protein